MFLCLFIYHLNYNKRSEHRLHAASSHVRVKAEDSSDLKAQRDSLCFPLIHEALLEISTDTERILMKSLRILLLCNRPHAVLIILNSS